MHTSSFLEDTGTDPKHFCLQTLFAPSDIHQSIIHAYHRKYLNIRIVWENHLTLSNSALWVFKLCFQKCSKGYIQPLYVHYVHLLIYKLSVISLFIFFNIKYEYSITLKYFCTFMTTFDFGKIKDLKLHKNIVQFIEKQVNSAQFWFHFSKYIPIKTRTQNIVKTVKFLKTW